MGKTGIDFPVVSLRFVTFSVTSPAQAVFVNLNKSIT